MNFSPFLLPASLAAILAFVCSSAPAATQRYEARYDATDAGVIIRHGDGPDHSDTMGMREPSIVQEDGKFYLFYDGCAAPGWLACLATSDDLKTWKKHGRMLSLGPAGSDDSAAAVSPWLIKEGDTWHMFYVATPLATPPPELVPMGPYLTMKATAQSLDGPWTQHRDLVPFRPIPGTHTAGNAFPGHILKRPDGEFMMLMNGGQAIARTRDLSGPWKIDEQQQLTLPVENTSIYYEPANGYYWMFINHIRLLPAPHTDATWVFWTKDPNQWNDEDRAVVLDGRNCTWSKTIIGMATVTPVGNRLAIFYDGNREPVIHHMDRDIGLAWLDLPLTPEKVRQVALPPSEEDEVFSERNAVLGGGFESAAPHWQITGGGRIALDGSRFPRTLWMGDYYLWLNGPKGQAEQTTALVAKPGETCQLTAEVGFSMDVQKAAFAWPGGRMILFTTGPNGSRDEASMELPQFSSDEAGTFKAVSLDWKVPETAKDRTIGVRLISDGPQIAWDNVRLTP